MNNEITVFKYGRHKLRSILINDEEWYVGKDACILLEYKNPSKALKDHVNREDKKLNNDSLLSLGQRGGWLINEAGLYSLMLHANTPEAEKVQYWITHEVLPAIRKNGAYVSPSITAEQVEQLQAELALLRKKALYAEMLEVSGDTCTIKELAALLTQAGFKVGQNKLFELLRNEGYLIKPKRRDKNTPTQKAIEMGLFVVEQRANIYPDARAHVYRQTLVTSKGQIFFLDRFAPQRLLLATA